MKSAFSAAVGTLFLTGLMVPYALAVEDSNMEFNTTRDLAAVCSVAPGEAEYIPASFGCRGFIEAAVQYHDVVTDRKHMKRLICYPETATIADGRRAFNQWAENNKRDKARMEELPVVGLVRALAEAYPCP